MHWISPATLIAVSLVISAHSQPIGFQSSSDSDSSTCQSGRLSKLVDYTGFKIQRHVVLKGLKPPLLHFVSLSNCRDGELETERLSRTGRDTDLEWDKPVCFLGNQRISDDAGVVISRGKGSKKSKHKKKSKKTKPSSLFGKLKNMTIYDAPQKPHSVVPVKTLSKRAVLKDKFLSFLKRVSETSFIEYLQDSKVTDYEDLKPVSYTDIKVDDVDQVTCYKFARRKKYALRELMLYAPLTWVGGLYQCNITDTEKKDYLTSLKKAAPFTKPYEVRCTTENSIPLLPLIADDVSSIQYEYENGAMSAIRTPYLYTPTDLDPRFGKSTAALGSTSSFLKSFIRQGSSDKLPYENWWQEVDVNENYTYTKEDINLITTLVNNATQMLKSHILKTKIDHWFWDDVGVYGDAEKERPHYLEMKTLFSWSKIKDSSKRLEFVNTLQKTWDDLRLTKN